MGIIILLFSVDLLQMSESSKNKLVSVRVTSRIACEIDNFVDDSGMDRPDVLRNVIVHGLRSYNSELFHRGGFSGVSKELRSYRKWMLNDDADEVFDAIKDLENRVKMMDEQINKKLDLIIGEMTKKKGFFK